MLAFGFVFWATGMLLGRIWGSDNPFVNKTSDRVFGLMIIVGWVLMIAGAFVFLWRYFP